MSANYYEEKLKKDNIQCDACLLQCNQYNLHALNVLLSSMQLSHFKTSAETLKESNTEMGNKVESYMQKLKEVRNRRLTYVGFTFHTCM